MPGKHHALLDLPLHLSPRRRLTVAIAVALLVFAAIGFRTGTSRHHPAQPMPVTSPPASASAEPSPSYAPSRFARVASPSTASPSASRSARRTQTPAPATKARDARGRWTAWDTHHSAAAVGLAEGASGVSAARSLQCADQLCPGIGHNLVGLPSAPRRDRHPCPANTPPRASTVPAYP